MSTPTSPTDALRPSRPRWPWLALGLAMVWVAVVRVPIVLNARTHLDSDLAVDGLTLIEALQGDWRWHYPGTPHIGTPAVALSLPQAAALGATPETLVSGGLVAYELLLVANFLLAWRAFGPAVAAWGLVPLAFASIGTVWLSGRITGGHLLGAAWHAAAFWLLAGLARQGGPLRAGMLGLWCGLGLYVDRIFLFSLAGLVPAVIAVAFGPGGWLRRLAAALAFAVGMAAGFSPHEIGVKAEPYDAYRTQFSTILGDERTGLIDWDQTRSMAVEHVRLLFHECLPRLIGGHRLPGFQSDPTPGALAGQPRRLDPPDLSPIPISAPVVGLGLFVAAIGALLAAGRDEGDVPGEAVRWGIVFASGGILAGFILNRNIYNSDNYRYLVGLLTTWSLGFGLLMLSLWRRGSGGRLLAGLLALALAGTTTLDTVRWYRGFGWLDATGRPVRVPLADPAYDWLLEHPEVDRIYGNYWDVYRLSFLAGGRVRGVPYPEYPDRYPEIADGLPAHRPRLLIARGDPIGRFNLRLSVQTGGQVLAEGRGVTIVDWPPSGRREDRP